MSYGVILPDSLPFDGDREFLILRAAYAKIGVNINEISGGDASRILPDHRREVHEVRHVDVVLDGLSDPSFILSIVTRTSGSRTATRAWTTHLRQLVAGAGLHGGRLKSPGLVWKMEVYLAHVRPYIILVSLDTSMPTTGLVAGLTSLWVLQVLLRPGARGRESEGEF